MSWLRRNKETRESETPEVKPRNQILQLPKESVFENKGKLDPSSRQGHRDFSKKLDPSKYTQEGDKRKIEPLKKKEGNASSGEGEESQGDISREPKRMKDKPKEDKDNNRDEGR